MNRPLARGDDPPAAKETKEKEGKEKEAKEKGKSRSKLPPYYGKVIDKEQRAAIYKIQEQYSPQIDELAKQLDALEDKRDAEISAVLTEEQRQKVAALIAEAKAAKKKPAASPSSATAAVPEGK